MSGDRRLLLVCQKTDSDSPQPEELYTTGTIAKILQMLKLPDQTVRVLVEGEERSEIQRIVTKGPFFRGQAEELNTDFTITPQISSLMKIIHQSFIIYNRNRKKISKESLSAIEKADFPHKLVDLIAAQTNLKTEEKAELLEITDVEERLRKLAFMLESENEVSEIQNRIRSQVKKRIEKGQKEYYLHEQLREINKELGRDDEDTAGAKELEKQIKAKNLPEEVKARAVKENGRLARLGPMSPEAGVLRTYLEWICDLPWTEKTSDNKDIDRAEQILNEDHYNLKKAKERILDFIAVTQLKEKLKGPILCFVGPPGTGKTSLGKSVARALGRNFVRISLGGVKDEAEIRGHRKTYVGAMPGKIIQGIRKAGTINPVFLLDEVDKISSDFRGDPASALLEVLDPEQNNSFMDHYLEVPYDLSNILFITTANSLHNIPFPLRDRMEIIELSGYTDLEKEKIAVNFILPKQLEENGLGWADITFQRTAILDIIRNYTMESGVRSLEREIATVVRKIAREAVKSGAFPSGEPDEKTGEETDRKFSRTVTSAGLKKHLGNPRFVENKLVKEMRPGLAYGLAWTELGGTLLPIEVALIEGKGDLILTGNLGEVMKESARTALSFIHSHYTLFRLNSDILKKSNVHIHVPEGAIPKDGPSAGITITAAILSAFSGSIVRPSLAMTGEVTLTGRLLPVGGIKEKALAAYRNKISNLFLPLGNKKDVEELPKEVKSSISFHFFESVKDALNDLLL